MPVLKVRVQTLLQRLGIYHRLQSSRLYDCYWKLANRSLLADRGKEVTFYRALLHGLRRGDLIFDVGANRGFKADIFLRLGVRVLAIEPDNFSQDVLKQKFLRYRRIPRPVLIVGKAVSDQDTVATLWIDQPGSGKNTLSEKWTAALRKDETRFGQTLEFGQRKEVETTTLDRLVARYGAPFFIKIDVEGHEASVLRGLRRPVPFVSFEVNLPEFRPEGVECVDLLARLAAGGTFNYAADVKRGLLLQEWLGPESFLSVLRQCEEPSIEVFWRTPAPGQ